ncbi:MAG: trimethylamine methyltransferase family protein [Planctomycetota bacterium]
MEVPWSWKTLSEGQVDQIRDAARTFIETDGFVVRHEGLLARAKAAGARVDETSGTVRVPKGLLAELMEQVPSRYCVANILGDSWEVGGESQHGLAIVTDPWIIDYQTRQPRRPCLEDLRRHTIIAQRLDPVVGISRMDFPVTDVPGPTSSLRALEMHLLHHAKHYVVLAANPESFCQWLDIAEIVGRGADPGRLFTSGVAVGSPLVLNELNAELLLRSLEHGFTVLPTICPMAGSTAPYSMAGTLLESHIEAMMVALLAEMVRPGAPVQYASGLSVTDMQSGNDLYYTIDKVLWKLAGVQLGLAENMPVSAECGGTLTFRYDQQSGAEGMLFMLAACASGAHVLAGFGSCYNAVGMSAEMMVIHDAYLRAARHIARGIRTDDLRLAVANLRRVGPGGHFLDDDLTLELLRSDEFFRDDIFDFSGGHGESKPLVDRAHERVEELVSDYQSPVPHDVQENLRRYFHDLCAGQEP